MVPNRYDVDSAEDFEPGSNDEVLKNNLGIISSSEMDQIEAQELKRAEFDAIKHYSRDHQFTELDIKALHKQWLKNIYSFAGKYRTSFLSKGGFPFAAPNLIDSLMTQFEKEYLTKYTPCHFQELDELALAIGIVHVELIIIHPFREGNGRVARLLSELMALQADYPLLDFHEIDQTANPNGYKKYISAIHLGFQKQYSAIQNLFKDLLEKSKKNL